MRKWERELDWAERKVQLGIDLMTILDDLIGSATAKMIFQSCPVLACHSWGFISPPQTLTGYTAPRRL